MNTFYLDSSVLVKRYIPEAGTSWVRSVTDISAGASVFIATITPVEVISAAMRQNREGTVSIEAARAIQVLLDYHVNTQYMMVGLTRTVVTKAQHLLRTHALRAYDAVQLASALEASTGLFAIDQTRLIFASSDEKLLMAANAEGLMTANPLNEE
jgi:uncharacterized protein